MEADAQNTQEPPPPGDDLNEHSAVQNQLPQLRHQMEHQQCEHQYQMEDIIARQEDLMQQLQYNLAGLHHSEWRASSPQESVTSHMHENSTSRTSSERSGQDTERGPGDLEKRYEKLVAEIEQIKQQANSLPSVTHNWKTTLTTPLSSQLLQEQVPPHYTPPKFNLYNGMGVYLASLQGPALTWYHQLPPHSISNFTQLCELFMQQYTCNTRPQRSVDHLFNLWQATGEPLQKFVHRFLNEMVYVDGSDQKTAIVAFRKALLPSCPLLRSLAKSSLTMMEELLDKANRYANMEEELDLPNLKRKISQVDQAQEWKVGVKKQNGGHKRMTSNYAAAAPRVKFTISPQELLLKLKDDLNFKWPPTPEKSVEGRDRTKYCQYHRTHGHRTNQCKALKQYLENLVQQGDFQQYVKSTKPLTSSLEDRTLKDPEELPELEEKSPSIIHVIDAHPASTSTIWREQ